jgi:hypothetical protein
LFSFVQHWVFATGEHPEQGSGEEKQSFHGTDGLE